MVLFCFVENDSINQAERLHDKRYVSYMLLIPEAVYFGSIFMNPHPLDTREKDEAFQDVFDPDFKLHKEPQSESQHECVKDKTALENIWNVTGGLDKLLSFVCVFCGWNVSYSSFNRHWTLNNGLNKGSLHPYFRFERDAQFYINHTHIFLYIYKYILYNINFLGKIIFV